MTNTGDLIGSTGTWNYMYLRFGMISFLMNVWRRNRVPFILRQMHFADFLMLNIYIDAVFFFNTMSNLKKELIDY